MKHKIKLKDALTSAVFIIVIGGFFIANLLVPAPAILISERRVPAKFPELTANTVFSGNFMGKFDAYAADNFVLRDEFRRIRSFMVFDIYMLKDKSGLYRSENVGIGEFARLDAPAFRQTAGRIGKAAGVLADLGINVYYSVVPDKSVFAGSYMPGFDINEAEAILFDVLGDYEYIRVYDDLDADSYYKTDLHWDQTMIAAVANRLISAMADDANFGAVAGDDSGAAGYLSGGLNNGSGASRGSAGEFRGVYAGQLALPVPADEMSFLHIPGLSVSYLNEKTLEFEPGPVYDLERLSGVDPYDLFLRGPQPLIVIESEAGNGRELYLFRDSFGSSLAPLLALGYSKVTIIDLRYIHMMMLDQFIEWTPGADALFIYSSLIFNNPSVLLA